jgi:hypothetical protein
MCEVSTSTRVVCEKRKVFVCVVRCIGGRFRLKFGRLSVLATCCTCEASTVCRFA